MAANGIPQSYLYQQRGQSDQYRDRSMEQSNTNSGNPYNYGPPNNRYIPPTYNPQTSQWNTNGQQYMTPGAYSGYTGQYDMPSYMPMSGNQQGGDPITGGNQATGGPGGTQVPNPQTAQAVQPYGGMTNNAVYQMPGTQVPANNQAQSNGTSHPSWTPQGGPGTMTQSGAWMPANYNPYGGQNVHAAPGSRGYGPRRTATGPVVGTAGAPPDQSPRPLPVQDQGMMMGGGGGLSQGLARYMPWMQR